MPQSQPAPTEDLTRDTEEARRARADVKREQTRQADQRRAEARAEYDSVGDDRRAKTEKLRALRKLKEAKERIAARAS